MCIVVRKKKSRVLESIHVQTIIMQKTILNLYSSIHVYTAIYLINTIN